MHHAFDVAVVGAGINGLCTAYHLAQQPGVKVLLLEQFELKHCEGSSHSKIRITRAAYPDPLYAEMAEESRNNEWPSLEQKLGEKLVLDNKFVAFGHDEIYQTYRDLASKLKLPTLAVVAGSEAQKLCSVLNLDQFKDVVMDSNAGIILAERTMHLLIEHLKANPNVTIKEKTAVKQVKPDADSVTLQTNKGPFTVGRVVLTLGRWAAALIPDIKDLIHVNKQTVMYVKLKTDHAGLTVGKYMSWMSSHNGEEYYSLPAFGQDWIKVAQHDNVVGKPKLSGEKQIEKVLNYIRTVLKHQIEGVQKTEECYYTTTVNQQFIIDYLDEKKRVLGSSTCSGHSFKFGPLVGRVLSDMILTGTTSVKLFRDNKFKFSIHYHKGVDLMG